MRWRCSGPGASIAASVCKSTPTGRSPCAAAWAPAIDCGRPSVSGTTMPGNSTALRVGRRIIAPSGSWSSFELSLAGLSAAALCALRAGLAASADCGVTCSLSFMVLDWTSGSQLGESENETTVAKFPFGQMQARGKRDAALEAAVRNLQPQDIGAPPLTGEGTDAGNHQGLAFDLNMHGLRRHAGKGGDDQKLPFGFKHIDGRLPARRARPFARGNEELAMELLGLLEHGAGFGPHLTFRVTHDCRLLRQTKRRIGGTRYMGCRRHPCKGRAATLASAKLQRRSARLRRDRRAADRALRSEAARAEYSVGTLVAPLKIRPVDALL